MKYSAVLVGVAVAAGLWLPLQVAGKVLDLTADTFHTVLDGSQPALVEFYASWCGHW
jgi:hypothetical protein